MYDISTKLLKYIHICALSYPITSDCLGMKPRQQWIFKTPEIILISSKS